MSQLAALGGSAEFKDGEFPADSISLDPSSIDTVTEVLEDGELSLFGETTVQQFEDEFASFIGTSEAIGVTNCTAALDAAVRAICETGDEVVLPAYTYNATLMAVLAAGCDPTVVDIDPETHLMDLDELETAVTEDTAAIIAVHMFGNPVEMDRVMNIAEQYDVAVIEDCAQATGATYNDQHVGSFGTGCHSFGSNKLLRIGEGGAITTSNLDIAAECETIRHEGEVWDRTQTSAASFPENGLHLTDITQGVDYTQQGHNFRLWPPAAALASERLDIFESEIVDQMRSNARTLRDGFESIPELSVQTTTDSGRVYTSFITRWDSDILSRDEMLYAIGKEGIPAGVHFPIAVHQTSIWKDQFEEVTMPVAENFCQDHVAFPVYPAASESDMERVVEGIQKIVDELQSSPDEIRDEFDEININTTINNFFSGVYFNV